MAKSAAILVLVITFLSAASFSIADSHILSQNQKESKGELNISLTSEQVPPAAQNALSNFESASSHSAAL